MSKCTYCDGKGTYSVMAVQTASGDFIGDRVSSPVKTIANPPCKHCNGTGECIGACRRCRETQGNPVIKFSHAYKKLAGTHRSEIMRRREVMLIQVLNVDLKDLSPQFLSYDTLHDEGNYPLKAGQYLMLIFQSAADNIFTTLRPAWPPQKEQYYRERIGKFFNIEVEGESRQGADGQNDEPVV